jgi:hypothetical protein
MRALMRRQIAADISSLAADGRSKPPAPHPPWPAHGNADEAAA